MRLFVCMALTVLAFSVQAQEEYEGPFRKGKFMSSLNGSIRSSTQSTGVISSGETRIEGYSIGTQSGKFFKERMVFGLNLFISRDVQTSTIKTEAETLGIGPWWRYYTSKDTRGSVYPEVSLLYINFNNELTAPILTNNFNSKVQGNGVGLELGVGFTYTISDNVGFDIGMNYLAGWLSGTTRTTGVADEKEALYLGQLNFRFGFVVMVNEFFF